MDVAGQLALRPQAIPAKRQSVAPDANFAKPRNPWGRFAFVGCGFVLPSRMQSKSQYPAPASAGATFFGVLVSFVYAVLRKSEVSMSFRYSNHRRSERPPVVMKAECRTQTGLFGRVEIIDLTREGCRIFAKGLPLRVGQRVRIKPVNFQPLPGTVRWAERDFAGIEFESALYVPVVEHLQKMFAPPTR